MRCKVNIEKNEDGFAVWRPGLPGCWSQGETETDALENIKDAIENYLKTRDELLEQSEQRIVDVDYA